MQEIMQEPLVATCILITAEQGCVRDDNTKQCARVSTVQVTLNYLIAREGCHRPRGPRRQTSVVIQVVKHITELSYYNC